MPEQPDDYLAWVLTRIHPVGALTSPVKEAFGRVLAADVPSRFDLPMWDASAMDGYAVRAEDTLTATHDSPVDLEVIGEIAAGSSQDPTLRARQAVRIMTGAPVPADADAVIPVELTRGQDDGMWADTKTQVLQPVVPGANIRRRSEDIRAGTTVAMQGQRLTAVRLSAVAAAGVDVVSVHRMPRIAVVSTGAELRRCSTGLRRGEVPESNSVLIDGLVRETGLVAHTIEHCTDRAEVLRDRLTELAREHDVVITTGGVGPGLHDVVRIALEHEAGIRALRVNMRPGQPQCSGTHSAGAFIFGLPGNPVSAAVSFELFVRPALRKMAGYSRVLRRRLQATAVQSWKGLEGKVQVLPVALEDTSDGLTCRPAVSPARVSHSVGGHGGSDGYALIGADRGDIAAGESVVVIETGPA